MARWNRAYLQPRDAQQDGRQSGSPSPAALLGTVPPRLRFRANRAGVPSGCHVPASPLLRAKGSFLLLPASRPKRPGRPGGARSVPCVAGGAAPPAQPTAAPESRGARHPSGPPNRPPGLPQAIATRWRPPVSVRCPGVTVTKPRQPRHFLGLCRCHHRGAGVYRGSSRPFRSPLSKCSRDGLSIPSSPSRGEYLPASAAARAPGWTPPTMLMAARGT